MKLTHLTKAGEASSAASAVEFLHVMSCETTKTNYDIKMIIM